MKYEENQVVVIMFEKILSPVSVINLNILQVHSAVPLQNAPRKASIGQVKSTTYFSPLRELLYSSL